VIVRRICLYSKNNGHLLKFWFSEANGKVGFGIQDGIYVTEGLKAELGRRNTHFCLIDLIKSAVRLTIEFLCLGLNYPGFLPSLHSATG
jgi:hypothetical protein